MAILVFDPVGEVHTSAGPRPQMLDAVNGARIGYVFNQHVSAMTFWEALRRAIEISFAPSHSVQIVKKNYTAPAAAEEIATIAANADYALVGVGA